MFTALNQFSAWHRPMVPHLMNELHGLRMLQQTFPNNLCSSEMALMIMCVTLLCLCFTNLYLQGKTNNFAHPALKEAAIKFFYTGSYHIANKHPNLFRNSISLSCLALIGAAVFFLPLVYTSQLLMYIFQFSITVCSTVSRRTVVEKPSPTSWGRGTTLFFMQCWGCYTIFRRTRTTVKNSKFSW